MFLCVTSPLLTRWTHSARISWFRSWPAERRGAARSALSLIICCLFVKLTAAREEYLRSLWSPWSSYSKLLATQLHSSRPLGHPQAVPTVGASTCHSSCWAPFIEADKNCYYPCLSSYPPSHTQWMWVSLRRTKTIEDQETGKQKKKKKAAQQLSWNSQHSFNMERR